jgi:hypothetical protein
MAERQIIVPERWAAIAARHIVVKEGLIAGFLGATSVAIWFLAVDTIAGHPFRTPTVLGMGLLSFFGPRGGEGVGVQVIAYTIVHYTAFMGLGILVSFVVNRAEQEPSILAVFLLLLVAFELGFYAFVGLLSETALGQLAWYQVLAGNVIAALVMGVYMWRLHPALKEELQHALVGDE